jgi:hypothetical protein
MMTTRRLPQRVSGCRFVPNLCRRPVARVLKERGSSVRHRLNVMQGGASMAPPVARCSNGPTPCWRIFARALPLRGRICVRSRLLARVPSLVSSGDLNGSTASPTSTAMRGLPSPRHKAGNGTGLNASSKSWRCPRFGPVSCLAALAPVTRRFLVLPLVWPR